MNLTYFFENFRIRQYWTDSFYRNSFFLILSSLSTVGFGFIFWLIAANMYSQSDIGIAATIISSISIIVLISRYGFDQTLVSYLPADEKRTVFFSIFITTTIISLFLGIAFIIVIEYWAPNLELIKKYELSYIFLLFLFSTVAMMGVAFIAVRKAILYFFQNMIIGLRVLFLIPLMYLGVYGILFSYGISLIFAILILVIPLVNLNIVKFKFDQEFIKESFNFSAANYFSGLLSLLSIQILPIMVFSVLGSEATAEYFIVYSIASILFIIPSSIGLSLFVEGSHNEIFKFNFKKSSIIIIILLIPAIILFSLFGSNILSIFGEGYVQNQLLLTVMCISSLFVSPINLFMAIKKIEKNLKALIFYSVFLFFFQMTMSYYFMKYYGPLGIGFAWLFSYSLLGIIVIVNEKRIKD